MMPRVLLVLHVLMLLINTVSSCAAPEQTVAGPIHSGPSSTLEDAIQQVHGCTAPLDELHIHSIRPLPKGSLVLYTATCPPDPGLPRAVSYFGYALVDQQQGQWMGRSGTAIAIQPLPSAQLVDFGRAGGPGFVVIFGQVLNPEVAAIEVTFADGTIMREWPTNSLFAVVSTGASEVRHLRIFGADGKLLLETR